MPKYKRSQSAKVRKGKFSTYHRKQEWLLRNFDIRKSNQKISLLLIDFLLTDYSGSKF